VSKLTGFLQLRRGLFEHVRDGRMSVTQALAFIYICSEADTRSGIWKGSAKSLSGELGISERTARDALERMERGDYIRRFAVPGRHSCYPILVHKYLITDGKHSGEQLNAIESTGSVDLRYFSREHRIEGDDQHDVEHGAAQKRIEKRDKRKTSLSDGKLPEAEGFEKFYAEYPRKKNPSAARKAWLKVKPAEVDTILARLEVLKLGEWKGKDQQYIPYPASWLNDRRWEDEIETRRINGTNGKSSAAVVHAEPGKYAELDRKRPVFTN
jgi:hypothetical protein